MSGANTPNPDYLPKDPRYQPIWDAISAALAKGARNISIWDGDHGSPIPRNIVSDRALYDVAAHYGKPLYVFEDASPGTNEMIAKYRDGTAADRKDTDALYANSEKVMPALAPGLEMEREFMKLTHDGRIDLLDPDPRGARLAAANFTTDEFKAYGKFFDEINRAGGVQCYPQVQEGIEQSWPWLDKQNLLSAFQKISQAAVDPGKKEFTTTDTDRQIVNTVRGYRAANGIGPGQVQVTFYGEEHFAKPNDLNQAFPGISIAVVDAPGAINGITGASGFRDTPDYVWYINQQRLVKLDTQQARNEFLGPQHGAQQREVSGIQSAEVRQNCLDATQHLRTPVQPTGQHFTPPANTPAQPAQDPQQYFTPH